MNALQLGTIDLNVLFVAAYIILFALKRTAERVYILSAVFVCITISYTAIYDSITAMQYYLLQSFIYALATIKITEHRALTSLGCLLMSVFQLLMAWDENNNDDPTFLWQNYEIITCCIHSIIIGSCFRWPDSISIGRLEYFINRLRCWVHG